MQFVYTPINKKTFKVAGKAKKIAGFYARGFSEDQISDFTGESLDRVRYVCAEYRGQRDQFEREQTRLQIITLKLNGEKPKDIAKKTGVSLETVRRDIRVYYENCSTRNTKRRTLSRWRIERRLGAINADCYG